MINQYKTTITIFLLVCISVIGYLLGQTLLKSVPPADPEADRISFRAGSSPGLSGLFLNYDIYVMNVNSPGLTRLTHQAGIEAMPAWSPSGNKIVYYGADGMYIMNADGSGQLELLWNGITMYPVWSPDGSKIAFADYESIRILDLHTKRVKPLMDSPITSVQPSWSPNGSKIAFTIRPHIKTPGGGPESAIAIINVDGSDFVQLTEVDGSSSPAWSPDGSHIAFHREGNIYVMNPDGSNVTALTQDGKSYSPTWSPDSSRIAFVSFKNSKCGGAILDSFPFCTNELHVMDIDGSNVAVIRSKKNENIADPAWAPRN